MNLPRGFLLHRWLAVAQASLDRALAGTATGTVPALEISRVDTRSPESRILEPHARTTFAPRRRRAENCWGCAKGGAPRRVGPRRISGATPKSLRQNETNERNERRGAWSRLHGRWPQP